MKQVAAEDNQQLQRVKERITHSQVTWCQMHEYFYCRSLHASERGQELPQ